MIARALSLSELISDHIWAQLCVYVHIRSFPSRTEDSFDFLTMRNRSPAGAMMLPVEIGIQDCCVTN